LHFVHMVLNRAGNINGVEIFKELWNEYEIWNLADLRDVRNRPHDNKQVEFASETNRLLIQLLRKHIKLSDREHGRESKTILIFCFFMMNALIWNNRRVTGFQVRFRLLQSDVAQIHAFHERRQNTLIDEQGYIAWMRLGATNGYDIVPTELPFLLGDFMAVPKTMRDENHRDRMNTGLDIPKEDKEQSAMPDFKLLAEEVLSKTIEYEKIKNNLINTDALPGHCRINEYSFDGLVRTCTTVVNVYQKLMDNFSGLSVAREANQKTAWQLKAERIRKIKEKARGNKRKRKKSCTEVPADKSGSNLGPNDPTSIAVQSEARGSKRRKAARGTRTRVCVREAFINDELRCVADTIAVNVEKFHQDREQEIFKESEEILRAKKERGEQLRAAEIIQAQREAEERKEEERKEAAEALKRKKAAETSAKARIKSHLKKARANERKNARRREQRALENPSLAEKREKRQVKKGKNKITIAQATADLPFIDGDIVLFNQFDEEDQGPLGLGFTLGRLILDAAGTVYNSSRQQIIKPGTFHNSFNNDLSTACRFLSQICSGQSRSATNSLFKLVLKINSKMNYASE